MEKNSLAEWWGTDKGGHRRLKRREVGREEKSEGKRSQKGREFIKREENGMGSLGSPERSPVRNTMAGSPGRPTGLWTARPDGLRTSPAPVGRRDMAGAVDSSTLEAKSTIAGYKRFGNRHWCDSWTWIDQSVRDTGGSPDGRQ